MTHQQLSEHRHKFQYYRDDYFDFCTILGTLSDCLEEIVDQNSVEVENITLSGYNVVQPNLEKNK